jgi:hypothetical protein
MTLNLTYKQVLLNGHNNFFPKVALNNVWDIPHLKWAAQ